MEIVKVLFIAKEVCEKNSSKELECTLGPKLGFPCSFHVATDNIVAFELTRLQDFNAIIVAQNKSKQDFFDISDLLNIMKALDGCCPPMIFLTDDESQLSGPDCSDYYYVRCSAGNEFVLDELCATIVSAVHKIPNNHNNIIQRNESIASFISTTSEANYFVGPFAPVNLQSSFAMELDTTTSPYDNEQHQLSSVPMSVPVVEEDNSASFTDEFDFFLADLCDATDDASSTYNNSFLTDDDDDTSRSKRRYSFDSEGEDVTSSVLVQKKIKTQFAGEGLGQQSLHHQTHQYTTILDPVEFDQLLQMFPVH